MLAPEPLRQALAAAGLGVGRRRLAVLLSQLGDFDSLEYGQALAAAQPALEGAGIAVRAFAIGEAPGAERFCRYTGLPPHWLQVEAEPRLHRALELYPGLRIPGGPWPALLLMCAGVGSPGTLAEVLRGYTGDRSARPRLSGAPFSALGEGYLRPFELATVRLRAMQEVLAHWSTYVPRPDFLTQRGGTFLLEADDSLLYSHRDRGILGFSETMAEPLRFLDPWLSA